MQYAAPFTMSRKIPSKVAKNAGFIPLLNPGSSLLNICLFFFLFCTLVSWQVFSLEDTDQDEIINIDDIDDDNDGIPDAVEQYCTNPDLANSTSGSGAYQDDIYWFNWTGADFEDGLQDGDTQTFNLSDGTQITATISNVVNLRNAGGEGYVPDDMNTWSGARLHQLYNTDGESEVFHSGGSTQDNVSFDISFSATKNGRTVYPDYVFIDGESTNGKGEYIKAVANQGYWKLLEDSGPGASYTGLGTQSLDIRDTESKNVGTSLFYIEDATQFSIEIFNHGGQAVGFGILLECDTDGDGIYNQLDLDSDNDGIPDIIEAGGADTDGDGLGDQATDSDGDGLMDIFETSAGNTSSLFDTDGDGVNEVSGDLDGDSQPNWADLDSDGDGILDIKEMGGTDLDNDGQIDTHETDTDADGYGDKVDGDIGNDGIAENSKNTIVLTSADTNADGKPDSGYNSGDTDYDGKADFLDIDADADGIVDNTEAQPTIMFSIVSGADSDRDGIDNNFDNSVSFGGNGLLAEDTDGDLIPDYQDTDTDEDGILDQIEGHDTDGDHIADANSLSNTGLPLGIDIDNDGLDDGYDNNTASADPTNSGLSPASHPKFNGGLDQDWRAQSTLDIEYEFFELKELQKHIFLTWKLSRDWVGAKFQVFRKIGDAGHFEKIGQVLSNAAGFYTFKDPKITNPHKKERLYYQLNRISPNNKFSQSAIRVVSVRPKILDIEISPNPASSWVQIRTQKQSLSGHEIKVLTAEGKVILKKSFSTTQNDSWILDCSSYPPGLYIIHAKYKEEEKQFKLLMF